MKKKWLNLVLILTNRIYEKKRIIANQLGFSAIFTILSLIALEIVLGFISLPLYLGLKSEGVTAFMSEKGTYEEVPFDYNLRRILTLTGVGLFGLIWAIKLIIIITLPSIYGPLPLYSVSNFSQIDALDKDLIINDIVIQTARVIETMPRPELTAVNKLKNGNYDFIGKGEPNTSIVLLLSDQQTAIYTTDVDANGGWKINHLNDNFRLSEGNHSILIFSYNKKLSTRSQIAPEQFFKVTTTIWDSIINNTDTLANWSVVIILVIGVFITFLTI